MDSASVYRLKLLVLEGTGGKTLATDHRDYKTTVNQSADVDQCSLPSAEDLCATLAIGQVFSKIDLSHAYQQVELDEESQKYSIVQK